MRDHNHDDENRRNEYPAYIGRETIMQFWIAKWVLLPFTIGIGVLAAVQGVRQAIKYHG